MSDARAYIRTSQIKHKTNLTNHSRVIMYLGRYLTSILAQVADLPNHSRVIMYLGRYLTMTQQRTAAYQDVELPSATVTCFM